MNHLKNKRILLGIGGSIAAYKCAGLVRELKDLGADVRVVMSAAASQFVTPLTLQAVSGHSVRTDLFDAHQEQAMGHIELARWADVILIAPATADIAARLAHGHSSDLLSAICLARTVPLLIVPAMNQAMWQNTLTQANFERLRQHGIAVWGPAVGDQACGEKGPGRMLEPQDIVARLQDFWCDGPLKGCRVLITAGPTREAIDPVRYISNRSSGKMGFALANAALDCGASVTLVSGPVDERVASPGVDRVDVESAEQMKNAVMERISDVDIFIGAAAVADYRPSDPVQQKMKKQQASLSLQLEPTIDILKQVAEQFNSVFSVGFAAETERLEQNARAKLETKGLDMIAANLVGAGKGFEVDENALQVIWSDGSVDLPRSHKDRLARELMSVIVERYHATHTG